MFAVSQGLLFRPPCSARLGSVLVFMLCHVFRVCELVKKFIPVTPTELSSIYILQYVLRGSFLVYMAILCVYLGFKGDNWLMHENYKNDDYINWNMIFFNAKQLLALIKSVIINRVKNCSDFFSKHFTFGVFNRWLSFYYIYEYISLCFQFFLNRSNM